MSAMYRIKEGERPTFWGANQIPLALGVAPLRHSSFSGIPGWMCQTCKVVVGRYPGKSPESISV